MTPHASPGARHAAPTTARPEAAEHFGDLGVDPAIVDALDALGVTRPFPIQAATIPDALAGRDVLGRGRTGSGKTVAFAVPLVAAIAGGNPARAKRPSGLVLVPTRELARQVVETLEPLAAAADLSVTTIHGGVSQVPQLKALRRGVDIVVACPGRLEDLIGQGHCRLDGVKVTVLDEADHMADLGFLPPVKRLLDQTPGDSQRLLFSATLDNGVDVLVRRYLNDPVTHEVDPSEAPVPDMEHHLLVVNREDKPAVVAELASGAGRTVLFMRTKHAASKLAKRLTRDGIPSVDLHGNLTQGARTRNLESFSSGRARVLVATDIAARGIHVDDVALVVHVDPPAEEKAYLHRSGRTARAGAEGTVVTLVLPEQRNDVRKLTRKAGIDAAFVDVRPGDATVRDLVGPAAPLEHRPVTAPAPSQGRGPGAGGGGAGRGRRRRGGPGGANRPKGSGGQGRNGGRSSGGGRSGGSGPSGGARSGSGARAGGGARQNGSGRSSGGSSGPSRPSRRGPRP
ncbi:MAG: DEAD/DEAH box helicase [Microthrixaceae bacterium]